jgi:hypothetical protein
LNYLGLPLSLDKVGIVALLPSIGRVNKYLAGWKAVLLNTMGRAVLTDSVPGNLLIYTMGAMELPKGRWTASTPRDVRSCGLARTKPAARNASSPGIMCVHRVRTAVWS